MLAVYAPLFDKIQRHTHRYIRQMSAVYTPLFDKVDVHSYIYIQRVLAYTFSRHVSPTNLRFSFGSCRFRCIIFVLLLTCLAAFALTLLVCLFAAEKETTARAGDPCNAAQHCRCHPVGLQQKVAATHAVNHIGPHLRRKPWRWRWRWLQDFSLQQCD